jgi:hypothetical protein
MQCGPGNDDITRPLTDEEQTLARWMLEHGTPEAQPFLAQLGRAQATLWRCPCGCPSFNFKIPDHPPAPPGVHILADFIYGTPDDLKGIFIYEKAGILSGLEVFGYAGDHPTTLPAVTDLRPITSGVFSHETVAELLAQPPLT